MTDSTSDITPPSDIRIDREGKWYFKGAEMVRKEIVQLFYQHLKREASGRYIIEMPNDRCYIEVEDVPFIIKSVYMVPATGCEIQHIQLFLNDETQETLEPASLRIGKGNILYCSVKDNHFDARFSRASYYQIAEFIGHDSEDNSYHIDISGIKYPVKAIGC